MKEFVVGGYFWYGKVSILFNGKDFLFICLLEVDIGMVNVGLFIWIMLIYFFLFVWCNVKFIKDIFWLWYILDRDDLGW